jgi:hypothetical protein
MTVTLRCEGRKPRASKGDGPASFEARAASPRVHLRMTGD